MKEVRQLMMIIFCVGFMVQPSQAVVWVGNDLSCDFNTIQEALDLVETGADNIIRVANNVPNATYNENLSFQTDNALTSVFIYGGYDTCQGNSTEFPTTVDGNASAPVLNITGDGSARLIVLSDFTFKNGLHDLLDRAGGLNIIGNNLTVDVSDSTINQNTGIRGGGVSIDGTGSVFVIRNTNIVNNQAQNGGGIACDFGSVRLMHPSSVSFNTASSGLSEAGDGGGLYINLNCDLLLQTGDDSVAAINGVIGNQASRHGGGIYAGTSSKVTLANSGEVYPVVKDNIADADNNLSGFGGGMYFTGFGTEADINSGIIAQNEAVNGGGIAVDNQADVDVFPNSGTCPFKRPCTQIRGNRAGANSGGGPANGLGGALYANNEANLSVIMSAITENEADSGIVAATTGAGFISMVSNFITDNGDTSEAVFNDAYLMFANGDNSRIDIARNTIAGNDVSGDGGALFLISFGAIFIVEGSIIQDDSEEVLQVFNDSGQATFVRLVCNVMHETNSLSGADQVNGNVISTNPEFVDSNNGDYHILPTSVAVDMCDDYAGWPRDIDSELKGFDDLNVPNVEGPYDAGADETYLSDVIFRDNFEQ